MDAIGILRGRALSARRAALRWLALLAACACGSCVLLFGAGAAGGVLVATDRRSAGIQLEDTNIEIRINHALDERFARESVRIDVTSYNERVLLAGQVPTEKDRVDAETIARNSQNVRQVINELTLGSLAGLSSTMDDTLTASKVRAALLGASGLPANVVKTACTDGNVYLFGLVSRNEADIAKRTASQAGGVKRVVAAFEILSDAEMEAYRVPAPAGGTQTPSGAQDAR